ncbi:hypothetical protein GJ744_001981 [Endocarpon pusillum]|uniref:Uncharacterized protein n=1 Tax=Endocarpon pusillum TaxID=364733 RepID=A0A8H7E0V2_9EURO|nr:hypothetical protein GJ744_001981 [Endocarpon pusillum]
MLLSLSVRLVSQPMHIDLLSPKLRRLWQSMLRRRSLLNNGCIVTTLFLPPPPILKPSEDKTARERKTVGQTASAMPDIAQSQQGANETEHAKRQANQPGTDGKIEELCSWVRK